MVLEPLPGHVPECTGLCLGLELVWVLERVACFFARLPDRHLRIGAELATNGLATFICEDPPRLRAARAQNKDEGEAAFDCVNEGDLFRRRLVTAIFPFEICIRGTRPRQIANERVGERLFWH